jgi:hypothetical protein
MASIKGGKMNRTLKVLVAGALLLGSSALWALGSYIVWSAERVMMAAVALAVMGFVIYL